MTSKKQAWAWGLMAEKIALLYLRLKGYRLIHHRYRTPLGEIDLLMKKGNQVVAVEVKARKSYEEGLYALTSHQQKRLQGAMTYFMKQGFFDVRFDLIVIIPLRLPLHLKNVIL